MSTYYVQALSHFGPVLLGVIVRSSAFIVAGGSLVLLLRSQTAELRHFVWRSILYGVLLLPLIECVAPPVRPPSRILTRADRAIFFNQPTRFSDTGTTPYTAIPIRHAGSYRWALLATPLYLSVASTLLLRLLVDLFRLKRLVNRSELIQDSDLYELAQEVWLQSLCQRRPGLRASQDIRVPMAIGIEEVTILLPANWTLWSRQKLRAALIHEMAHIRRNDPETTLLASLTVSLLWLNPLVYWLRRQLVVSAEEACDEAVLSDLEPEEYARILIDFATEVGPKGRRLSAVSMVAVHRSLIKARLEHIMSMPQPIQRRQRLLRALLTAVFVPVLYLAASGRFDQRQVTTGTDRAMPVSVANEQQAIELESQLLQDPNNLSLRGALMAFYANEGNGPAFTPHLLWVINHHPEAPLSTMKIYSRSDSSTHLLQDALATRPTGDHSYELTAAAWDNALNAFPNSPDVLFHAGLFIQSNDPRSARELFGHAAALVPVGGRQQADYLNASSAIYATAFITRSNAGNSAARVNDIAVDPNFARTFRTDLESSNDPALLSRVGNTLVQSGQDEQGLSLIQRAVNLDPSNPKWKEALDSAKAEPVRRYARRKFMSGNPGR